MAGKSSRFAVAVHVLTLLAQEGGRALTSEYIAGSVNTNPVVIRRLLGLLSKAGLVSTTEGAGGGTTLARPAGRITLGYVYRAVEAGGLFGAARNDPDPLCQVGKHVQAVLEGHVERFEAALEKEMGRVTVADVLAGVRSAGSQ
jgi:Rrf2 family protein